MFVYYKSRLIFEALHLETCPDFSFKTLLQEPVIATTFLSALPTVKSA